MAVLIVEDEVLIRMTVADALSDAGFEIVEAENGDDALRILQAQPDRIHAIFTDVNMPGQVDGIALAHAAAEQWPWVRLLVTSGRPMPANAPLPTVCRFLAKPYELRHVIAHLNEMTAFR